MSATHDPKDTLWAQRFLSTIGLKPGPLDGIPGRRTLRALAEFEAVSAAIAAGYPKLDMVSEQKLRWLAPEVQSMCRQIVDVARANRIDARPISGVRTYVEQDALYAIGRTTGRRGHVVTNARGGRSMHQFARACDFGVFVGGKYTGTLAPYDRLGALVAKAGVKHEWGGNWDTLHDAPHYQLTGGRSSAAIRRLFEAGTVI